MSPEPQRQDGDHEKLIGEKSGAPTLRGSTLIISNVTKVVGLLIVVNEARRPSGTRDELLIAAGLVFVSGLQAVENVLMRLIDRLFSRES